MVKVVLASLWRNSAHRVATYMARAQRLKVRAIPFSIRVMAVEGDSTDNTRDELVKRAQNCALNLEIVSCNHGGPVFGSSEAPERMAALSTVLNSLMSHVREEDEILLYVESDLEWTPHTLISLAMVAHALSSGVVVAPLVMAGEAFYDIWGFRGVDGNRFSPFKPFFPRLLDGPIEVGSVGSCFAASGEVARKCRVKDDNALVGWCKDVREQGYHIWVHPELEVRHP